MILYVYFHMLYYKIISITHDWETVINMGTNSSFDNTYPVVSIVTICYNAAKDLPLTMDSVLAQDYDNYEYIIQDGNSTDGSFEIIESYRQKFTDRGINFIYNREDDNGIYDAMNKGCGSANGKYINYMNAGDCFYSSTVLSDVFDRSIPIEGTILFGDCAEYEFGRFNMFLKNLDRIEEVMPFSHQSVFAKTDFLKNHPFNTSYRYSADYDFLLTAHDLNEQFTDTNVLVCITTKDGVSSVNYHDMLIESAEILKSHNKYHHTDDELAKIEKTLKLKQFVLDNFPVFIKKSIRAVQIKSRGQALNCIVPPWYKKYVINK